MLLLSVAGEVDPLGGPVRTDCELLADATVLGSRMERRGHLRGT